MARVVRKVSNKSARSQKKGLDKKQKTIIGSIVGGIIVVVAVVLTIVLILVNNNTTEEFHDYLSDTQTVILDSTTNEETTVNFTKMSYSGVLYHHNNSNSNTNYRDNEYVKFVFVYAQDFHNFYPDESDEDNFNQSDKDLLARLARFQARVDEYNKTASDEDQAVFYLVDTYYDYNQGIFDDEYVGTSGDVTITSMFCLLAGEGCDGNKRGLLKYSFDCNVEGETKKLTMFEANNGFSTDRGNQAYNLLKSGFDNYEKGYISEDK